MSKEMGMLLGAILGLAICLRETLSKIQMPHQKHLRKALIHLTTYTIAVVVIIIIAAILEVL